MSGSSKQSQKNELSLPDFYKPYWNSAMQGAQAIYDAGGFSPVVGMSDETSKALDMNKLLAGNLQDNVLPGAQKSFMDLLQSNLVGSNELTNVINSSVRPVMQNLERYALPATQDAAIMAGQSGSSRQGIAEGLARSDANKQMMDIGSQLTWNALQQDQQNRQFAQSILPQFMATLQTPAQLMASVGGIKEGYQQEAADAPANNLMKFFQLIQSMNPGSNSTTTATSSMSNFQKLAALGSLAINGYTAYKAPTAAPKSGNGG